MNICCGFASGVCLNSIIIWNLGWTQWNNWQKKEDEIKAIWPFRGALLVFILLAPIKSTCHISAGLSSPTQSGLTICVRVKTFPEKVSFSQVKFTINVWFNPCSCLQSRWEKYLNQELQYSKPLRFCPLLSTNFTKVKVSAFSCQTVMLLML